jgi:hypothetical protein
MKIKVLTPMIMALVFLLCGPFSYETICDPDPREGLICCCCSGVGKDCAMISCSCCSTYADSIVDSWWPEVILDSFHPIHTLRFVYCDKEDFPLPATVYLEVPDKPPDRV